MVCKVRKNVNRINQKKARENIFGNEFIIHGIFYVASDHRSEFQCLSLILFLAMNQIRAIGEEGKGLKKIKKTISLISFVEILGFILLPL